VLLDRHFEHELRGLAPEPQVRPQAQVGAEALVGEGRERRQHSFQGHGVALEVPALEVGLAGGGVLEKLGTRERLVGDGR
jgi:hypothetical protein